MPTSRPRISITKDSELAAALDPGAYSDRRATPEATLVHDLGVEGARLLGDEHVRRQRSLNHLADHGLLDRVLDPDGVGVVGEAAEALPVVL